MIALAIGHSRKIHGRYDGGAYSPHLETSERDFNLQVAAAVAKILHTEGIESRIISDYAGDGYTAAMRDAARQIKAIGAVLAVELHFNASAPTANGHEWLHWHYSTTGKRLAQTFHDQFAKDFPGIKSRGLKALDNGSRGAEFVKLTHCPAALLEPFFGTNGRDCSHITPSSLASSYAGAILTHLRQS